MAQIYLCLLLKTVQLRQWEINIYDFEQARIVEGRNVERRYDVLNLRMTMIIL